MAVLTGGVVQSEHRTGEGGPSWPVLLLTLAAVASSSLSALSMYQLAALRAEVEALRSDVSRRRGEGHEPRDRGQAVEHIRIRKRSQEPLPPPQHLFSQIRKKRLVAASDRIISQPCLQLLANASRTVFGKEFQSEAHTGIPWKAGLRRGSALEPQGDVIIVREAGHYFVYSQVYYMDRMFAMGHVVIRRKRNVVGNEPHYVILFRCIQAMNPAYPFNTCYTGGVVMLEVEDHLELLIPRPSARISTDGESTFFGAFKLA